MPFYIKHLILLAAFAAASACSQGSEQNVVQSADHSVQAASHGSAAVVSGAASVAAVPVLITGGALVVSGAGLSEVGAASLTMGSELAEAAGRPTVTRTVRPDGPPTLD